MKKFFLSILIAILCFGVILKNTAKTHAQITPVSQVSFGTLSDLRATLGTDNVQALLNGLSTQNDGNGGVYMWNSSSTAADDGFITIKPTSVSGVGRWLRIGNGNTIKGTAVFSGIALTTTYTVNYQQGTLPFIPAQIYIQPLTANAAALSYVSNITNTGFQVTFLTVPVLGTNNISFAWLAIKQ